MGDLKELVEVYGQLEKQFCLKQNDGKYATLVTSNGNDRHPIQRWFHLKEAFSLELLETLIADWEIEVGSVNRILDPFCGVGTSLLAAQKLARKHDLNNLVSIGIERNPFLHFVAQTKVQWNEYDARQIQVQSDFLLNRGCKPQPKAVPSLSTLHRKDVYDEYVLCDALSFREAICQEVGDEKERNVLLLGYASILEAISGVRKDGRALRIVPDKQRPLLKDALRTAWRTIAEDLDIAGRYYQPIKTQVLLGDGRKLVADGSVTRELNDFDLIIYSPPYLNNIDYTEVYKIELWMCGFLETTQEFRNLRFRTLRSHPSVRFHDPIEMKNDDRMKYLGRILDVIVRSLPKDDNLKWRADLFLGYFDDMYQSISNQMKVLAPGGWIFCIVGNSLHGPRDHVEDRVPLASDLLIALIAKSLGLQVKAIQIARYLTRRSVNSDFLRESILVIRKPVKQGATA